MKSYIAEMYYGNLSNENIKGTEEMAKLIKEVVKIEDELLPTLSTEQRAIYDRLVFATGSYHAEEAASKYIAGFKHGLLIGLELEE